MLSSYNGKRGRSLSTTDVFRLCERNDEDEQRLLMPSRIMTISRQQLRRPTLAPPPVPKRSDSFSLSSSASAGTLTKVRSYLSEDIRRQFESTAHDMEQSSSDSSPRSRIFVKRLVATLERRHKDDIVGNIGGHAYNASFQQLSRQDRSMIASSPTVAKQPQPAFHFPPRCELEELQEAEEEVDDFDCSPDEYFSGEVCSRPPIIVRAYEPAAQTESAAKSSYKRSIKSVLSSLVNWKIGKGLPKGSRDYYATRESLGEEMRSFRRDTMPQLMEHAAANSRLPEVFGKKASAERPRRDTQDFAKLIRRPHHERQQPSPSSIASIHPVYGSTKASLTASHLQLNQAFYATDLQEAALPAEPRASIPEEEHLLRPSSLRQAHKRLSHEMHSDFQLASSIYDVPRSNRPVIVQKYAPSLQPPPPAAVHYQNIGQALSGEDKRLTRHLFTTF